nr:DNA-directed DNA polymerase [Tanacetum cinerariifolium]
MARTTMNEHCSAVILNKLPRKLGDLEKFLIPCEFSGMDECLALADLGASINFMPLSVWEGLSLPELTPTYMTLELTDRSVSKPIGIAKDVSFKFGVFHFPADFMVVDFELDPRVPLILGRCFLKTSRDLIDEADAFLGLEDDPDSPKINPFYYDPERDILLLEAILNSEPSPPLRNQEQNLPSFKEELKAYEAQTIKSSVDEPPEVELKDLPHHLSPWVSPVHCVPKKGGFTVVENEENELIPTRLVTGWRVGIDYRKLNEATRKDHFPFSFMDQMLERLAGNKYYCFLDSFFGFLPAIHSKFLQNLSTDDSSSQEEYAVRFLRRLYPSFPNIEEKTYESSNLDFLKLDLQFELMSDASDFAICAVLGQRHEKHFKPIHYACKTMNDAETSYTTIEKEMLAVVYAFENSGRI